MGLNRKGVRQRGEDMGEEKRKSKDLQNVLGLCSRGRNAKQLNSYSSSGRNTEERSPSVMLSLGPDRLGQT